MEKMSYIELTNSNTGTKFLCCPTYFIIHKPSVVQATIANDPSTLSRCTTLMSIFNPQITIPVKESYRDIKKMLGLAGESK